MEATYLGGGSDPKGDLSVFTTVGDDRQAQWVFTAVNGKIVDIE